MAEGHDSDAGGTTGNVIIIVGRVVLILLIAVGVLASRGVVTIASISVLALMTVCGALIERFGVAPAVLVGLLIAVGLLFIFPIGVGLLLVTTIWLASRTDHSLA